MSGCYHGSGVSKTAEINLEIYEGSTFRKSFIWKSDSVAVDLTGYTAKMQVRATIKSSTALLTLTTENGGIVIEDQVEKTGMYSINISSILTANITNHIEVEGIYDLKLISALPDGDVRLQQFGIFTIKPVVTRD